MHFIYNIKHMVSFLLVFVMGSDDLYGIGIIV